MPPRDDQSAQDWAYDHTDPDEITDQWRGRTVAFSTDPAHYLPLCRSCHSRFDARETPEPDSYVRFFR